MNNHLKRLSLIKIFLILLFLSWTFVTFFQVDSALNRIEHSLSSHFKKFYDHLYGGKIERLKKSKISVEYSGGKPGDLEGTYCLGMKNTDGIILAFQRGKYFLFLDEGKMIHIGTQSQFHQLEEGEVLFNENKIVLINSVDGLYKEVRVTNPPKSKDEGAFALNYFGRILSSDYCLDHQRSEVMKRLEAS